MRLEFLGTGTSQGVPEILCDCAVCTSPDPRDQRLRSSVWVTVPGVSVVVDVTPDFRQQCLRCRLPRLDAVFLTHLHADHFLGLDDLRRFNRVQRQAIPVHVPAHFADGFRQVFGYALADCQPALFRPRFDLRLVDRAPVALPGLTVLPVPVDHGTCEIRGYVFAGAGGRLAYLTDCRALPPATVAAVSGADVIVLSALWRLPHTHACHLNLDEALALAATLGGRRTYLTHLTHHMGRHADTSRELPPGIALAHDGLVVELGQGRPA